MGSTRRPKADAFRETSTPRPLTSSLSEWRGGTERDDYDPSPLPTLPARGTGAGVPLDRWGGTGVGCISARNAKGTTRA